MRFPPIRFLKYIQAFVDFLLILSSFTLAYFIRVGFVFSSTFPFPDYVHVFVPTSIVWLLVLIIQKVYTAEPIQKRRLFTNIITANLIGVTFFVLMFFFNRDVFFSRMILVYTWGISNILIIGNAWAFRYWGFRLHKLGIGTKKTLIVGANKNAEEAIFNFQNFEPYYEAVAIVDAYGTKKKHILGVPVLGKMNSLEDIVQEKNIDVIVQADCVEQSLNLIQFCEQNKKDYFLVPNLLGLYKENVSAEMMGRKAMITLFK